eukprot:scaffold93044_cov62-Phaeocystis_antarctica.AAC.3
MAAMWYRPGRPSLHCTRYAQSPTCSTVQGASSGPSSIQSSSSGPRRFSRRTTSGLRDSVGDGVPCERHPCRRCTRKVTPAAQPLGDNSAAPRVQLCTLNSSAIVATSGPAPDRSWANCSSRVPVAANRVQPAAHGATSAASLERSPRCAGTAAVAPVPPWRRSSAFSRWSPAAAKVT